MTEVSNNNLPLQLAFYQTFTYTKRIGNAKFKGISKCFSIWKEKTAKFGDQRETCVSVPVRAKS